jgi:hypothetical protein
LIEEPSLHVSKENWKEKFDRKRKRRKIIEQPVSTLIEESLKVAAPDTVNWLSTLAIVDESLQAHNCEMRPLPHSSGVLETSVVQRSSAKGKSRAQVFRYSNHLIKRVVWAADDKAVLSNSIETIRTGLQDLQSLLEYRVPQNALKALRFDKSTTSLQDLPRVQATVKHLHDALITLQERNGTLQRHTAVQLRHDCQGLRELLPEDHELTKRTDSFLFLLHVHGLGEVGEDEELATEVLAESSSVEYPASLASSRSLSCFQDLRTAIEGLPCENELHHLGAIAQPPPKSLVHQMFSTQQRKWFQVSDLSQALETDDMRHNFRMSQRLQLASLIAGTHAYFAKIRTSCTEVRPSNFRYYHTQRDIPSWDEDEPYVLNPYLSIGFGSRKPTRSLGSSSGVVQHANKIVVELGLLLYQIGSGSNLDYGRGGHEGFRQAKLSALHAMRVLGRCAGPRFAEVTELCLTYNGSEDDGWKLILGVEAWLRDVADKLGLPYAR